VRPAIRFGRLDSVNGFLPAPAACKRQRGDDFEAGGVIGGDRLTTEIA
jgi:hypothetical protein